MVKRKTFLELLDDELDHIVVGLKIWMTPILSSNKKQ